MTPTSKRQTGDSTDISKRCGSQQLWKTVPEFWGSAKRDRDSNVYYSWALTPTSILTAN